MAINLNGLASMNAGARSKVSDASATVQQGAAEKQSATTAAQNQPTTVKLSSEAQMLSKLEDQLAQLPDADEDRIASIKQAIANGTFSVNPERIASKLASLEDQLFS